MRPSVRVRYGWALAVLMGLALGALAAQARSRHVALGAHDRAKEQLAVEQVLREQQQAWNDGNVEKFMEGYWHSPELTFSGSMGVQRGWDAVLARYKKSYPDRTAMGKLNFSGLETRFLGPDAALVLGEWRLTRPPSNDVGGVFSLVFQKFPEGWRIIHDHTSVVAASAH